MKFQFTFAALLAFVVAAAAASAGETAYPIESHDLGPEGTLTVYGIHGSEKRTLQARACGDQNVICSPKHAGTKSVCAALVNQVCDSDTALSKSPRSICLVQSGAQCCISWSADVGAISAKSLCPAARNTLSQCDNNVVSGLQRNTPLGGGCVTQCLSNRPDQCA